MTATTTRATASSQDVIEFPANFLWGVATSSFQIEGGSEADGKGLSIWDVFCRQEGTVSDQSDGTVACDHYNRWPDDIALMKDLGIQTYRFSISWPRVMASGSDVVNHAGLDFYDRLVDGLLEAGIVPAPTLYHWDLPQALGEKGGWLARTTAEAFADYTEAVVTRLGDRIPTWMTLNEPFCAAHLGYARGEHAPGHTNLGEALVASHHLMLAHGLGLERIRSLAPEAEAGIVLNFTPTIPETDSAADRDRANQINDLENHWYSDALAGFGYPNVTSEALDWDTSVLLDGDMEIISKPIDVLGVNFYTRNIATAVEGHSPPRPGELTDMGWEIHPPALEQLLCDLHDRYHFPKFMITENGAAMADSERTEDGRINDLDRIAYFDSHLRAVHRAIELGVPITGYYAWSLMDNFEWAFGYEKRFGIVEVDFESLERLPKQSALWYSSVIGNNGIMNELGNQP